MAPNNENGWLQWGKYVLKLIEDHDKKLDKVIVEIAKLKVKSGVWGLIGGSIPVAIFIALRVAGKI